MVVQKLLSNHHQVHGWRARGHGGGGVTKEEVCTQSRSCTLTPCSRHLPPAVNVGHVERVRGAGAASLSPPLLTLSTPPPTVLQPLFVQGERAAEQLMLDQQPSSPPSVQVPHVLLLLLFLVLNELYLK